MNLDGIRDESLRRALKALEHRSLNHLTGNPNLAPGGTNTNFQVSAFTYVLGGVARSKAAANNIAPPGSSTDAGQYRKVLICIDEAGAVSTVAGAIAATQAAALAPMTPANKLPIGVLELPASFTSGTTPVTSDMCKALVGTVDVSYV